MDVYARLIFLNAQPHYSSPDAEYSGTTTETEATLHNGNQQKTKHMLDRNTSCRTYAGGVKFETGR